MTNFAYQAVNGAGQPMNGTLAVTNQNEALRRIREMGLFPIKLTERRATIARPPTKSGHPLASLSRISIPLPISGIRPRVLSAFTRQLATLIDAGMPLLRGLRILEQQETNPRLKRIIGEVSEGIEGGGTLTEALAAHPKVFNGLYVNMVRAGEVSGALEITLRRLAEFMEKAQKIKGKVKAAMFYPAAVLTVAMSILALMVLFIVPRFQSVFEGLTNGKPMPVFTQFVMRLSEVARHHAPLVGFGLVAVGVLFALALRTQWGRWGFDLFKLRSPVIGTVFRKAAISRLARTLGTLLHSGVPVLQALTIARETAGNKVVGRLVGDIHESVKQGETVTAPLRGSVVFSPVYVGMVDVGEQTGALPDMLLKIADQCDDDVDNAVSAMTSLLEPLMIVLLAIIVGGIVIAMFLPIIGATDGFDFGGGSGDQ
ncbi:MAG: pilus assembly protein [Verrucomicrobiota bacterium]|jgi:type IV pilus assembly protein PilC